MKLGISFSESDHVSLISIQKLVAGLWELAIRHIDGAGRWRSRF
jgi:hypothetical protein